MVTIGIDNGPTGSIGIINDSGPLLFKTPVTKEQNYTKTKQNITMVEVLELVDLLKPYISETTKCYLERPMVNPFRFKSTLSAVRALQVTIDALKFLKLKPYYVDSKSWQKALLPIGIKGSEELKKASLEVGKKLFPTINFKGFKDSDSLLIAEYYRRREVNNG